MALGVNKVTLIGNLGQDPQVRPANDTKVATFSMATTESYQDREGKTVEKTEWHRIVAWRGLAEIIERYVKKGDRLYIEGKLATRSYEKEGQTHYVTEIVAQNLVMLSTRGDGSKSSGAVPPPNEEYPTRTNTAAAYTASSAPVATNNPTHNAEMENNEGGNIDDLPF
ncbi:single-stranded DNA-binding protein [Hugenholtzia roseola]|uniref:single-stranded DNA-binding protein n=1 Tax=Hugenholtzia roseola TaxID=1002 RepID=UPI0004223AC7|nr:single-stranded DNA-binding protein [Hugenholtzia roseola]